MAINVISRRDAHAKGLKRFYTGEPCVRSHYAERFVANGGCVECAIFKTPPKFKRPGYNTGMPHRALVFNVTFRPLPEEIHAAFAYMEANRWHDAALQAVHDDPTLLERYAPILSDKEARKAQALVDGRNRVLDRLRATSETVNPSTEPGESSA